jgi:hypothetical protein
MLLPSQLAGMRLGIAKGWTAPVVAPSVLAAAYPVAWGRIVSTPRVAGDNTRLGDCFPTACCNAVETHLWSWNQDIIVPNDAAVAAYQGMAGYNPADPATDQGTQPEQGFAWWQQNAIAGFKLSLATPIDPGSVGDIRHTISSALGVLLCIELSTENQNQRVLMPDGQKGSWGAHAVWMDGYDGSVICGTSWGLPFYLDEKFIEAGWVMAAYAVDLVT